MMCVASTGRSAARMSAHLGTTAPRITVSREGKFGGRRQRRRWHSTTLPPLSSQPLPSCLRAPPSRLCPLPLSGRGAYIPPRARRPNHGHRNRRGASHFPRLITIAAISALPLFPSNVQGARNVNLRPFSRSTAFMMGNEGSGLSAKQMQACDAFVYIPQVNHRAVEQPSHAAITAQSRPAFPGV